MSSQRFTSEFKQEAVRQVTERGYSVAEALEVNDGVVLYAKLPSWFKVPTPLGPYNPDWAVLFDQEGTLSTAIQF